MKWTWDRDAHINFEEKQKMDKIEELTSKNPDQTEGFKDRRPEWAAHDYIYIVNTSAIKTSRPIQFKTEVNKSKLSNTFYVLLLMIFIYITKIQSRDLTIYSRNFLRYCPDYTFLGQNSRTRLLPDFQFCRKLGNDLLSLWIISRQGQWIEWKKIFIFITYFSLELMTLFSLKNSFFSLGWKKGHLEVSQTPNTEFSNICTDTETPFCITFPVSQLGV